MHQENILLVHFLFLNRDEDDIIMLKNFGFKEEGAKMSQTGARIRKKKRLQRALRIVKHLRLLDDVFFRRCLKDNIPVAECILRIILEKPDLQVLSMQVEYVIPNLQGRSVRLDVRATDSTGKIYDIEMQRANEGAGKERARYNSSLLDLDSLKAGDKFKQLPETYVIFITENDVLRKGLPRYHVDRVIRETQDLFDDGEHILYINASYEGDDDIGKLMHDFRSDNVDDMLLEPLKETANRYKNNPKEAMKMSRELDAWLAEEHNAGRLAGWREGEAEGRAKGMAEGRAEGRAEGKENERMSSIRAIMKNAGYSAEKAMELLGIDKSLWKKYLSLL